MDKDNRESFGERTFRGNREALLSLATVAAGIPLYHWWRRREPPALEGDRR